MTKLEYKRIQKNRGDNMSKTITLRLKDEIYNVFLEMAKAENRSISNFIETAALNKIREQQFVDDVEMAEILSNQDLLRRIQEGSDEARNLKGRFVE
jgi:predicted CopG family antitoxin